MGIAKDYGDIMKILVNDDTLKTLMDIPVSEQTNYGLLTDKYFLQTFVSDKFTNDGICRLLIRSAMQTDTRNEYVKWHGVMIEIYVPKHKDLTTGFQTRINQIVDRLIELLNRTVVNYNKLIYAGSYESVSGSNNFKRENCKFEYKKIIR